MTTAVERLARQVAARAKKDAGFAQVLDALLPAPTTPQGTLERVAARTLNDQRRASLVQEFVDEFLDQRGAALIIQRASGNAFEGSLRRRRSREQCVEDLREAGVFLGPSSHLASEPLDRGRHSRSLRLACAIETIETNTGDEVGSEGRLEKT